jgi:hypothetical protein
LFAFGAILLQFLFFLPFVGIPKFFYILGRDGIRKAGEYAKDFLTMQEGPASELWPWQ